MTPPRLPIIGGPADGLTTAPGEKFVGLEVVAVKRSLADARGALYELRNGGYFYAGRMSVCTCGTVFTKAEGGAERGPCPLCGATVDA